MALVDCYKHLIPDDMAHLGELPLRNLIEILTLPEVMEAFDSQVARDPDGCDLWTGPRGETCGHFGIARFSIPAHKAAWIIREQQSLSTQFHVIQTCGNDLCVKHIDLEEKRIALKNSRARGLRLGRRPQLTHDQVVEIREATDKWGRFAQMFDVPRGVVYAALYGTTWGHLKDPPPRSPK